ncbi:carboxymuconolactone decarboxylase family protein [Klebsiella aerogenes]|nr:carboxymuconolactone decarboxylase family protein [Klebsiella aerogenes]MDK7100991.1 carboxymuconolactone decarboxylase family protein [Klebsiella aerogenes]MDK7642782.1 carboxymuconolactone decarboxylase family protein [Klebsiella aerogenes]MDK7848178.1 carboxymuconolactone decarboxylase family protein [Klebsiella aerogenes]MDK8314193.1 carboxymuconolactone decarboxylase family protein [Klebsiella aerogenes]MEC4756933.1 carboxymuconolactone decarboxylase family protein [Klebsiella aerogene
MPRITIPELDNLTDSQKEQYARFPANLTLGLLATSCSAQGYLSLGASFPAGKLNNKDREMIIMRVGCLSRSPYERMQHYPLALKSGWTEEEISLIEAGALMAEREATILKFVEECVAKVKVSDKIFNKIREFYDDTQIAELTLIIGHYMMTARFLETLEIPLDSAATSWDAMSV